MSDPLVFISKCWAGKGTKNGRVCRCRHFAWLGLLPLCCMAAGSLFGLAAHTWRMINTLAALHIRSVCRDVVCFLLPSSPEPRAYCLQTVCVKLCLLYDLSNTSLCGERCARVSSAIPTICFICLCLLSSSLDSLTVADQQRRCSTGRLLTTGRLASSQPASHPASHAVRRFNRLSPRVESESPTSVIAFRQGGRLSAAIVWHFRCRRTFLNHK